MAALNGQRTFLQIQNEIGTWLFNQTAPSANTFPTLQSIKDVVNKWYKRFAGQARWEWAKNEGTVATVNGTTRITMPDTVMDVANLNIRNISQPLLIYPRQKFLQIYPSGWTLTGNGIPQMAVEAIPAANGAKQYDLWPTPNAIFTINYDAWQHVTPLAADGDYSIIPPEFDDILVHGPISEFYQIQADPRNEYHEAQVAKIMSRVWMQQEQMTNLLNTIRGDEIMFGQPVIFPYQQY
jgi:hypothetical protein